MNIDKIIPQDILNFFKTKLFENSFLVINLFSVLHFFIGALFFLVISRKFWKWAALMIAWELFEFVMIYQGIPLFNELWVDSAWDLVFGSAGFLLMKAFKNRSRKATL